MLDRGHGPGQSTGDILPSLTPGNTIALRERVNRLGATAGKCDPRLPSSKLQANNFSGLLPVFRRVESQKELRNQEFNLRKLPRGTFIDYGALHPPLGKDYT